MLPPLEISSARIVIAWFRARISSRALTTATIVRIVYGHAISICMPPAIDCLLARGR